MLCAPLTSLLASVLLTSSSSIIAVDLSDTTITYERSGGMLPAPFNDGSRCLEIDTIEISPQKLQRTFWCSENSSSTPNKVIYSREATLNFFANTDISGSLFSLLNTLDTRVFSGESTVSDDVVVELRIHTNNTLYSIRSLRHDKNMGRDHENLLAAIEQASFSHLQF